jgi:hypothetical protein
MLLSGVLLGASPAMAEVMDKEPTLASIWLWAVPGAVGTYLCARKQPFLGLLAALVSSRNAMVAVSEWHDPFVGPAMLKEAGAGYGLQSHVALMLVLASLAVGTLAWYRSRYGRHEVAR